ncbi:MAG: anti-sigma factor antagonist [Thermotogaceae bacterium]|jgi:anti-sigma B factor antagonist|nr:anti-sigma factor antagonist [Thermotogaceae bacterium]MDN5338228.1 anti-sigma factor antagonist [Thermotogaceae bacterium]
MDYVESYTEKNFLVIRVNGDIDAYHSGDFKKAVKEKIEGFDGDLILVLDEVPYIDSAGLGTLVSLLRDVRTRGREMFLVGLRNNIKKIFEMTRLDRVFRIHETVEEITEVK